MDKEMMAKVNEVLKANDRRELSMDELDKVSGGIIYDIRQCQSLEDINSFVYEFLASAEQSFGRDVVADILKSQIPSYDVKEYYFNGGDLDKLHNFLCQHFERGWKGF